MSNFAIVSILTEPASLVSAWERGDRPDDNLAAWQRYGFWHPWLPEVVEVYITRTQDPVEVHTAIWWRGLFGTYPIFQQTDRALSTFALLFALAVPTFGADPACKVNVNAATPAELALLVQTGPALAGKIEAARTAGPLDAAKLDAVPGVGVKWLEYNTPYVAYDGETTCKEKQHKPAALAAGKDGAQ